MSLSETLEAIDQKKEAIEIFAAVDDPRTQASRDKAIIDAKSAIAGLETQYRRELYDSVLSIFSTGGTAERRAELKAQLEQLDSIVVDADTLYKGIAERARPYMGPSKNQVTSRATTYFISELTAVMNKYDPAGNVPTLNARYANAFVDNQDQLIDVLRSMAYSTGGIPLTIGYSQTAAFDEAQKQRVNEPPVVLVVLGVPESELRYYQRFFFKGRPSIVINLDEELPVTELVARAQVEAGKIFKPVAEEKDLTPDSDGDTLA